MADPVVHITNGIPDSGTGNITTLGAVVTALGTPMQATGGSVTANAGTNLNTSALALETGGNLATMVTRLTSLVTGTVLAAGTALVGIFKIGDGTNNAAIKAASTAPTATDPALVVAISPNSVNANGSALSANSAPVTQAPTSFRVAVTPTVTAGAYTAGNVLGGIMTFASALLGTPTASPTKWSAILESICVKFKATAATGEIDVAIFTASPSGGTYTDKTAPTANAADQAKLVGIYALTAPLSTLGTMTCYNLDGIGAAIDGASTSLFAVVTVKGTPTPASTTDVIVELGVLQG